MSRIRSWLRSWNGRVALTLLAVLLLTPASEAALSGLVLCLEGNGQVALEYAEGAECTNFLPGTVPSDASVPRENALQEATESDHCAGCRDISLQLTGASQYVGTSFTWELPDPQKHVSVDLRRRFPLFGRAGHDSFTDRVAGAGSVFAFGPHVSVPYTVLII